MINLENADKFKFNIIASGTGTGKTYFIANDVHKQLPWVQNSEILFVASRSLIVDQQSKNNSMTKFNRHDSEIIDYWNGKQDKTVKLNKQGIQIMTYDKIIEIITEKNELGMQTLSKVKVIVFDECHSMFSDKFISNMEALKVWIRDVVYIGEKLIVGLTATPDIIAFYQPSWGVEINQLNNRTLIKYKAKQLLCTNFDTIPYLVATQLEGRTMILCYSYNDCLELQSKIPNSFVLVSKHNNNFTPEMEYVREYIIRNEVVPETYTDVSGNEKHIDVLLTTSALREGINLRESGGIKNIVSCFSDDLHVIQFAGRARYNLDSIIVAKTYIPSDNINKGGYLETKRKQFDDFMNNKDNISWFSSVMVLVDHDVVKVKRFILGKDETKFINFINSKWLMPKDETDNSKYRIYREEDKKEIVELAIACKLLKLYDYQVTFNKIIITMSKCLGYTIEDRNTRINYKNTRYKLVVDYDESKQTMFLEKMKEVQ